MIDNIFIILFIVAAFISRESFNACLACLLCFAVQLIGFETSLPDNILSALILCMCAAGFNYLDDNVRSLLLYAGLVQFASAISNYLMDYHATSWFLYSASYVVYLLFAPLVAIINTLILFNVVRGEIGRRNQSATYLDLRRINNY